LKNVGDDDMDQHACVGCVDTDEDGGADMSRARLRLGAMECMMADAPAPRPDTSVSSVIP